MSTIAIVQARVGSTRLPGKVLTAIGDRPLLRWVLDRLAGSRRLDGIVVATSTAAQDDVIAQRCGEWGAAVFRGSESDVLGRFAGAADAFHASTIVRVNADNPLIDPAYIDQLVAAMADSGVDYASYRRADGRPVMLTALSFFAEAVSRQCLDRAAREITDPFEREHVTLGIYRRPDRFDLQWLDVPEFCNDARLRFTLDTPDDLALLREVIGSLGDRAAAAGAAEIVAHVCSRPQWLETMTRLNDSNPKGPQNNKLGKLIEPKEAQRPWVQ